MAKKYGPTRGELLFRIGFSVCGLIMMIALVTYRGAPSGPAALETVGMGSLFFGGTLVWSLWKLLRADFPSE